MSKFKVGQKVHIKEWIDMPKEVLADMGTACHTGDIGIVVKLIGIYKGYITYDVKTETEKHTLFCFEGELKSLVKVGEQLMFDFMEK